MSGRTTATEFLNKELTKVEENGSVNETGPILNIRLRRAFGARGKVTKVGKNANGNGGEGGRFTSPT